MEGGGIELSYLISVVQGILVGVANIIPGVSGGTFALVLGIYERLLAAIGAFGINTIKVIIGVMTAPGSKEKRSAFAAEWKRLDATWILVLALGAAAAILASSHLIAYLLESHLSPTLSFFIGLIIPSMAVPYKLLERKSWPEMLACCVGVGLLISLTLIRPASGGNMGLIGLFVSGAIAISAMILPGVSGSFMLMIMGEYKTVLDSINNMDLTKLVVFAAGCLVGLLAFVRLLNYLLKRFHSTTMAFLLGLILGSLWVLWPFKELAVGEKIVSGINVLPTSLTPEFMWSMGGFVFGLVCSAGIMILGAKGNKGTGNDSTNA